MVKAPQYKCPKSAQLFELLWKKRVIFIIKAIDEGADTYTSIRETIGSANTTIVSQRLDELWEYGLIQRKVVSEKPVQIRYSLTKQWKEVTKVIDKLTKCVH